MCGAEEEEEEGRRGRRAVRLHGRLFCRRRCNAASETCRKKPSGESGPESTLCALSGPVLELYNWNSSAVHCTVAVKQPGALRPAAGAIHAVHCP